MMRRRPPTARGAMMKHKVVTLAGEDAGEIDLADAVFGVAPDKIRKDILHRMVRYQLAKRRRGTHKTQERGEVSRTTAKLGRQKGGGRARHGSRKANIFVGGGVAHGPRPRSYAHDLPKRVRRMALAHALSARAAADALIVVEDVALEAPKTAALRAALAALGANDALVIGGAELDRNFALAARNLASVDALPAAGLNVYDVLRHKTLVMTRAAVEAAQARVAGAPATADGDADGEAA